MDEANQAEVCPHCGRPSARDELRLEELSKIRKLLAGFKESLDRELRLREQREILERGQILNRKTH